ncbi:MAG TPA: FG-GAP-like repeat-containing protein, partial [Calditrichia bacterium]|nr:FG-GAP-like repeat-containing protein [Calditrichia bacterium]
GFPDLYLTNLGFNQLFHNNGDGSFTEVTATAGVAGSESQLSSSALWFDYDLDGDLDLYVGVWADYRSGPNTANYLYENLGNGTFADVSGASGLADPGLTWTTIPIDANNDGHIDLYLANDFGDNKFYLNNGDKTFQEKTADYGLENPYHGMGVAVTDCDGNGYFDIYLTNITETGTGNEVNPLFMNTGQGLFLDQAATSGVDLAGWGWGTTFFDLENDGDQDLMVVTGYYQVVFPNYLFRNDLSGGSAVFNNVAAAVGMDDTREARGVVAFDYDRDGDEDILISNFTDQPALYQNNAGSGSWLSVALEGTAANRDGLGARVEVQANGKTYHRLNYGAQFFGQNLLPVHLGLGTANRIDLLTVHWPGGGVDRVSNLATNQHIVIREGEGMVTGIGTVETPQLAQSLELIGNYPNPFNGGTVIRFHLARAGEVSLKVYALSGQLVHQSSRFFDGRGEQTLAWDPARDASKLLSSGVYLYQLQTARREGATATGKMLYVK